MFVLASVAFSQAPQVRHVYSNVVKYRSSSVGEPNHPDGCLSQGTWYH
jgi:hypothetical protein